MNLKFPVSHYLFNKQHKELSKAPRKAGKEEREYSQCHFAMIDNSFHAASQTSHVNFMEYHLDGDGTRYPTRSKLKNV